MKETFRLKSIEFNEGNNIPYGQDFRQFKNVPSDIKFKAEYINDERIKLTAPGYGIIGNYGNGSIYVSVNDLKGIINETMKPN